MKDKQLQINYKIKNKMKWDKLKRVMLNSLIKKMKMIWKKV